MFPIYFLVEGKDDKGASAQDPGSHGSCAESKHPVKDLRSLSFSGSYEEEPCSVMSPRVGASLNFVP